MLIDADAPLEATDADGETPLYWAMFGMLSDATISTLQHERRRLDISPGHETWIREEGDPLGSTPGISNGERVEHIEAALQRHLGQKEVARLLEEAGASLECVKHLVALCKLLRERQDAKESLQNYVSVLRSAIRDGLLEGKISDEDKVLLQALVDDARSWIDSNQKNRYSPPDAPAEEYLTKQKEIEAKAMPVMQRKRAARNSKLKARISVAMALGNMG